MAATSGLDLTHLDTAARPQDDLYGHVNGGWLSDHVIPADRATDGAFRTLADQAERDVRAIIEEAAASPAEQGTLPQKIGDLYGAFMDTGRVEAAGAGPLKPLLAEIAAAHYASALASLLGRFEREGLASLV